MASQNVQQHFHLLRVPENQLDLGLLLPLLSAILLCCSSARQSQAFDEGIVAWRIISKQILLRP
jgi:hypothetical protein